MKVLICSDSHGLKEELIQLKKTHPDMDYYIHCGDSELVKDHSAIQGYHVVRGNCDFGNDFPERDLIAAGNERIFITHGHRDHVKTSLMNLHYRAIEQNATIVCFGHSHVLGVENIEGILFINPGSIALPRMRKERTYVILEINGASKTVHVYEYGHGELFQESYDI
ncbi:metallophosphoesterase [Caldibacillus thermoamylovorans]|uniref:metallophosphoesterase family protein n=1 Tax=Caldibacillus thermoamylovorans TaxID=35841 RepID=UPI001D079659|nr:metallophosphoesterase [Caldibacillus thermoamylovorans]MCB5933449.1 metallophosphoesterase [Bacillus sp. DFI.2.34]MCB7075632.1 metallophosphoesterase [Caldibacillus thermoamylovorans]